MMMVVVSYDVSTKTPKGQSRLRKVAKACVDHGQRVQNSVFECVLSAEEWTRLKLRLMNLYDSTEDSLRFYFLGSNWRGHVEHHGAKASLDVEAPLVV